jgi:hypothetical protein
MMKLNWITPEIVRGQLSGYRAAVEDGEYLIVGPYHRSFPATRTIEEYFLITKESRPN